MTAIRRLQPFRYLHDCSDCFRLERIAGWALHPLESAAFSRRTPIAADADAVRSGGIQSRARWRNCRHSNSAPTEPEAPAKAGSFGPTKMQELAGNGST